MTRDGLPRAYLRLDPNIDQTHPDLDGMVRLMCAAARQPERGRFKDRAVLDRAIGRGKVMRAIARGDVEILPDGRLYLVGWDEWQEGDHTVAERMRRMRLRRARHSAVTTPSPDRDPVTTDAGRDRESVVGSSTGVGVLPPTPAKRGLRAKGENPRALAKRERDAELERQHRAGLDATQRLIAETRAS